MSAGTVSVPAAEPILPRWRRAIVACAAALLLLTGIAVGRATAPAFRVGEGVRPAISSIVDRPQIRPGRDRGTVKVGPTEASAPAFVRPRGHGPVKQG